MVEKTKVETQVEFKKAPNLDLRGKVGNKVIGIFKRRIQGKFGWSGLIEVEETDGSTFFKEKDKPREEVTIAPGDAVFLKENKVLTVAFEKIPEGSKIEVVFTGTKDVGQPNPLVLYDINLIHGEK